MQFLWSLLTSRYRRRYFALLNQNGHCQAFKHCRQQPTGNNWVEVEEIRLIWLHQPLPANARVAPRQSRSRQPSALAA